MLNGVIFLFGFNCRIKNIFPWGKAFTQYKPLERNKLMLEPKQFWVLVNLVFDRLSLHHHPTISSKRNKCFLLIKIPQPYKDFSS